MDFQTLQELDLECKLTVAHKIVEGCECAAYFIGRREVLLPEVAIVAEDRGVDAVDLFAAYARRVHKRHEAGLSLATEVAA